MNIMYIDHYISPKEIARAFERYGYHVWYTEEDGIYKARKTMAERRGADIYVSIVPTSLPGSEDFIGYTLCYMFFTNAMKGHEFMTEVGAHEKMWSPPEVLIDTIIIENEKYIDAVYRKDMNEAYGECELL